MNNEPVAWGWYDLEIKRFFPHWDEDLMENKEGCIPLYTHPVKELTDEEILEIWRENEKVFPMDRSRLLDRTRACIKKAFLK